MSTAIRAFTLSDRDWALESQIDLYRNEYGFDDSFGVLCAKLIDDFLTGHDPERECAWVAERMGQPLGTVFCTRRSSDTAQLRLFFLVSKARGQGVGRAMLNTCMSFAETAGYKDMRLWTHRSHKGATALYRKTGWVMIAEEDALSFGRKEVVETYVYRF